MSHTAGEKLGFARPVVVQLRRVSSLPGSTTVSPAGLLVLPVFDTPLWQPPRLASACSITRGYVLLFRNCMCCILICVVAVTDDC
jgi:hypothetical protein